MQATRRRTFLRKPFARPPASKRRRTATCEALAMFRAWHRLRASVLLGTSFITRHSWGHFGNRHNHWRAMKLSQGWTRMKADRCSTRKLGSTLCFILATLVSYRHGVMGCIKRPLKFSKRAGRTRPARRGTARERKPGLGVCLER